MEQQNANKQMTLGEDEKKCHPQGTIPHSIGKAKPAPVYSKWEEEILAEEETEEPLALDCMIEKDAWKN
ncbi:hypothetical protein M514_04609 [Trichuris suis]|uniref:Uncharacterized protein n=1 Tax=Trichuris suis TaxID=68888 RepID=A0A085NV30_9BILA|nr:hypothetical protein M513_04609 [Trichuris suis]KFD73326.1 hypothetical protein M514_04609 [Trichuris suis]